MFQECIPEIEEIGWRERNRYCRRFLIKGASSHPDTSSGLDVEQEEEEEKEKCLLCIL